MKHFSKRILFIAGYLGFYGRGHYIRAVRLKRYLKDKNIQVDIFQYNSSKTNQKINMQKYYLIILDVRDTPFPSFIQNLSIPIIVLDNRGSDREKANVIWDTLPHFDMSYEDLQTSIQNILIPLELILYVQKNTTVKRSASKVYCSKDGKDTNEIELWKEHQIFNHLRFSQNSKYYSEKKYMNKLLQSEAIFTYFGQSAFEAIFLGIYIVLFPITPYHKKLNEFLVDIYRKPFFANCFLGNGYERLISKITEIYFSSKINN